MDDLMKMIRSYRLTSTLSERLALAERIYARVGPEMRAFVYGSVPKEAAEDALQVILIAIGKGLAGFKGGTEKQFWGWCHSIARHKIADQYRRQETDRTIPMEPEQLAQIMDRSAQASPMSPQTRLDLDYAMKLLTAAKPGCSDLLWRHYVIGLDYDELADENNLNSDAIRMRVKRCLDEAKALVA